VVLRNGEIKKMVATIDSGTLFATVGGGFFVGVLVGYALKKVIKLVSIVVGLFLAGLAYLQYQQVASINWDKLQSLSAAAASTIVNSTTTSQVPIAGTSVSGSPTLIASAMSNFGIPLTGSMAMGFAVGFMKG
jgi:uncharacterized membrane protein (Fun14 family)